ncbi:unnamed protein product [Cylindrotheca closterium]|uniref:Uncharacterized protein n=1 Tax=Cylindrotheca closterium TaxID=2856 RepID=A0AAD2FIQ6_9STRA|nr:unnamed protein product [Cylindrotheca closterium]
MNKEYTVEIRDKESEEKKERDEKFSGQQEDTNGNNASSSLSGKTKGSSEFSAVNMAGMVETGLGNLSSHSKGSYVSDNGDSKPYSQSSASHGSVANDSVWESDLNDEDEISFGYEDDDDDFYGTNGQEAAGRYPPQQELNPHIEQEYPIPHPPSSSTPEPQKPSVSLPANQQENNLKAQKGTAQQSLASKPAGSKSAGSRRSRRGSLGAPRRDDDDDNNAGKNTMTEEERRKRAFEERLATLERQSSKNQIQQQQQQRKKCCKCTRDIIPVVASLLLLAIGIGVAIFLLVGPNADDDGPSPTSAPTFTATPQRTIDPNPFRRMRGYEP